MGGVHVVGWCVDPSGLLALDFQNPSVVGIGGNSENWQQKTISAHADGGPRSRICTRSTLRSAPH